MVTDKELEAVSLEKNLKNIKEELTIIENQIEEQTKRKTMFLRQVTLGGLMHERALGKFVPLSPNWEFERDPEYLDWKREMTDIGFKFEVMKNEQVLAQIEDQLRRMNEQLQSQQAAKVQVEQQLTELKE